MKTGLLVAPWQMRRKIYVVYVENRSNLEVKVGQLIS